VARSRLSASASDESVEIIEWYREFIEDSFPPTDLLWEPVKIGPSWRYENGWVLPELTLGWDMLAWCGKYLRAKRGGPWRFTAEQARFLLWFYALEPDGSFLYHSAVLQRLKGWGKDPVAACAAMAGLFAPITFDHWDGDRPVGRDEPEAWVQLVAVSLEQTQNTMKLFPSLISPDARLRYGIQVQKTAVWGLGDSRQIQAVTSSPLAIEGGRPTLIVRNETQNWNSSNGGHDMNGAIDGNAAKSEFGAARLLDICNAYRPGEDSVGQRTREGWESTQGDLDAERLEDRPTTAEFGLMFDSLEAPPDAPLTAAAAPSVIEAIRGDSVWLNTKRIVKSIINPANSASESRRKWFNQITAAEDAWCGKVEWDSLADRRVEVSPADEIVMFLDCSKSDDATGLVGCRVSDGHRFVLGMWQRPPGELGKTWRVPREKVDARVTETMDRFPNVVAFWGDPSHVLDDESRERYWDGLFDEWHRRFKDRVKVWATPGASGHAVMWDMSNQSRVKDFTAAAEQTLEEIQESFVRTQTGAAPIFTHDGDARLALHVRNARRAPNRFGVSVAKRHRESKDKIDLAVCMIGAGLARRVYLNTRKPERVRTGVAYFPRG
jgi:hypothetical protein